MKNVFFCVVFCGLFTMGNAQTKSNNVRGKSGFSIGVEAGLPVGQYAKPYGSVIGGSLQYEALPAHDLGITFNAGYLSYNLKSSYGSGSVGFVPLMAGVKYYASPMVFFHAQLGAAVGTKQGQGTSFAYSPGLGVKLSRDLDAELKYMGISNNAGSTDNVGIRLGYNF